MLATTKEHEESYLIGRGNQNANILTNEFLWIKIAKQKRCIVSDAHNDAIYCAGDQSLLVVPLHAVQTKLCDW